MLLGRVARMYYELGMTHQEIANSLGLSRIRVTRMLAEARAQGIVEITVHSDEPLFADEQRALTDRFGLEQAWLSPSLPEKEKDDRAFALVGAEAIESITDGARTVALSLSSAVAAAVEAFGQLARPQTEFVPLGGSTGGRSSGSNPHELALRLAARTGGQAFHVPAPLVAATPEAARLVLADPSVRDVLARAAHADVVISGLGGMSLGEGLLLPSLEEDERAELVAGGAVGDIAARYFDAAARPVDSGLDRRIVSLQLDELRRIPRRLIIARGATKVHAMRAAFAGGLITAVATDVQTARELLS